MQIQDTQPYNHIGLVAASLSGTALIGCALSILARVGQPMVARLGAICGKPLSTKEIFFRAYHTLVQRLSPSQRTKIQKLLAYRVRASDLSCQLVAFQQGNSSWNAAQWRQLIEHYTAPHQPTKMRAWAMRAIYQGRADRIAEELATMMSGSGLADQARAAWRQYAAASNRLLDSEFDQIYIDLCWTLKMMAKYLPFTHDLPLLHLPELAQYLVR